MRSKLQCPNCGEYKVEKLSFARWCALILLFGNVITFGLPIIGWIFIFPMLIIDIGLVPLTIVAFCVPKLRRLHARCFKCRWTGELSELPASPTIPAKR